MRRHSSSKSSINSLKSARRRHGSRGFTTIEIALALVISAVLTYFLIKERLRDSKKQTAHLQADHLQQLAQALQAYVALKAANLVADRADPDNVGPVDGPLVIDLQNANLLPPNFESKVALTNSPMKTYLEFKPAACGKILAADEPPAAPCIVSGFVLAQDPFLQPGQDVSKGEYDGPVVGNMLERLSANGFARVVAGEDLIGAGKNFTIANSTATAHPSLSLSNGSGYLAGVVGVRINPVTYIPPTLPPTAAPTGSPTPAPTGTPTPAPTGTPTGAPTAAPTPAPGPSSCAAGNAPTVAANGTNGNGSGNQCTFTYPAFAVGSSILTQTNQSSSTLGYMNLSCAVTNGVATVSVVNYCCKKKNDSGC